MDVSAKCLKPIVSPSDEINLLVQSWSNLFSCIIEKHAPLKTIHVSDKHYTWISNDFKGLIGSRDKLNRAAFIALKSLVNKQSKTTNVDLLKHNGKDMGKWKEASCTANKLSCSVGTALAEGIDSTLDVMQS